MNEKTQLGIAALRGGDKASARSLLAAALKENPNDASAWLWLTGALDTDAERIHCLRQVLRIEPDNTAAARGLAQIIERSEKESAVRSEPNARSELEAEEEPETRSEPVVRSEPGDWYQTPTVDPAPQAIALADAGHTTEDLPAAPFVESEPVQAQPVEAAPPQRRKHTRAETEGVRVIFRTRPSVAPALAAFWLFLIGAVAVGFLLRENLVLALSLSIGLGVILNAIVIYAVIRNMAARYELTNQHLTLRFRGKRVRVPVSHLYSAEFHQGAFQRMLGAGDVLIEAAANGELTHLRLRNIPEVARRTQQIREQIGENRD